MSKRKPSSPGIASLVVGLALLNLTTVQWQRSTVPTRHLVAA